MTQTLFHGNKYSNGEAKLKSDTGAILLGTLVLIIAISCVLALVSELVRVQYKTTLNKTESFYKALQSSNEQMQKGESDAVN